jgi:hypothetical protein
VFLGWPTVKAILGQKIVPGYVDRYHARHGFDAQYTTTPCDPNRPRNLFEPVNGHHGAHGTFDDCAKSRDLIAPLTTRLGAAGVLATAAVIATASVGGLLFWLGRATRRSS